MFNPGKNKKLQFLTIVATCIFASTVPLFAADTADDLTALLNQPILEKDAGHLQIQKYLHARVPKLELPETVQAWEQEAAHLRQRILGEMVLRGFDQTPLARKPKIEWGDTIETGKGYVIRKLRYEILPGFWTPALMYQPTKLEGQVPVVLNPNGHTRDDGKADRAKQIRCINQAKRGMIALSPEWLAMGELNQSRYGHNESAYLDLCGQSGVGVFYLQLRRGLDVLLAQPNADPNRTAVTGLSGGGWQTILFSALDTRVKVAVPNAGYIGLPARIDHRGDIGDVEQNPSDLLMAADYPHLTALLAPRPALLIYNEKDNCCFPSGRARPSVYDPVRPLYEKYGLADLFQYHENKDPGTHNYELDNRQQLYTFLNRQFFAEADWRDEEIPSEDEVLTKGELTVGVPEDNESFYSLAEQAMIDLPLTNPSAKLAKKTQRVWRRDMTKVLERAIRFNPLAVTGTTKAEAKHGALTGTALRLEMGSDWTVPAVDHAGSPESKGVAIVFADGGRGEAIPVAKQLLQKGRRVIAVDLLMSGEAKPQDSAWQYAQMFATLGERTLGIRVAQLLAIKEMAAEMYPDQEITLAGVGPESAVAAAIAAALDDGIAQVVTVGLPGSLKDLIRKRIRYSQASSLFCFGLLRITDVDHLIALSQPTVFHRLETVDQAIDWNS
jgi:hypothetical protein